MKILLGFVAIFLTLQANAYQQCNPKVCWLKRVDPVNSSNSYYQLNVDSEDYQSYFFVTTDTAKQNSQQQKIRIDAAELKAGGICAAVMDETEN